MFEHCLYFNTSSLARQLEREWTKAFKPFGLTPAQAFMLRVVLEKAPISLTALADELNITKATCSRTADGIEKAGYVLRFQADQDGRSQELVPTQSAKQIKDRLNQAGGEVTKKIKRSIGNGEFENTVAKLRWISSALR
ncbi:MAG: MarR family transcriptional regulator [Rhodospirillales bacterium]|nr:MAG: MarR family transcriptional regulator [Rhodospirillales bacterium]